MAQKGISFREQILSEKGILLCLFVYNALLLFLCSRMSPLYDFNAWSDINVYFTIGKGWMNGLLPYRDLFDHKGPLIFLIYGIGYLIAFFSSKRPLRAFGEGFERKKCILRLSFI
ncbi:hypothetical protein M2132_001848 [Dysgonomonas sp. PH5-45]|uniref:hypothetical protein n=1 Tax=unclassified Dysgonomonas TaxID=2630389 RepID=UPI002474B17F|nr:MULTISPECIES: hypothetical protein [unclassified Dysgonomonas]MDH6355503.1 hypothetical protein [Dysgonomonas sp. PH5-45]MDH6388436.1 hypothetical protein [Dysgonomonas sp. PH5-37]